MSERYTCDIPGCAMDVFGRRPEPSGLTARAEAQGVDACHHRLDRVMNLHGSHEAVAATLRLRASVLSAMLRPF